MAYKKVISVLSVLGLVAGGFIMGCKGSSATSETTPTRPAARPAVRELEEVPYCPLNGLWPGDGQWSEPGFDDLKLTAAPRPRQTIHCVQKGDTLAGIARLYFNDATAWQRIYAANRQTLSGPNKLHVGMRLVIPE